MSFILRVGSAIGKGSRAIGDMTGSPALKMVSDAGGKEVGGAAKGDLAKQLIKAINENDTLHLNNLFEKYGDSQINECLKFFGKGGNVFDLIRNKSKQLDNGESF